MKPIHNIHTFEIIYTLKVLDHKESKSVITIYLMHVIKQLKNKIL